MSRRKVSTSRTSIVRGPLGGVHATTRNYEHEPRVGPSRTSRALATTGVRPWSQKRFAITAWVLVLCWAIGTAPVLGGVFFVLSAVAFGAYRLWPRPAEVAEPKAIAPGPAWCDHCADWTVHVTESHAA